MHLEGNHIFVRAIGGWNLICNEINSRSGLDLNMCSLSVSCSLGDFYVETLDSGKLEL
jgi:hypothetical protein